LKSEPAPGKKVRCPKCEHAFVPPADDDDEKEDEAPPPKKKKRTDDEDDAPRSSKKSKGAKKKSSMPLLLLLGGGAMFVALLACGGILFFVFGRGNTPIVPARDGIAKGDGTKDAGKGGGPVAVANGVTKANYDKLELGLNAKEMDDILGVVGKVASRQDAINYILNIDTFDGKPEDPLADEPTATYRHYAGNGQQILVGFIKNKKYGDINVYFAWFEEATKKNNQTSTTTFGIEGTREYGLKVVADREASPKFFADAKWKKGPEVRTGIIGSWKGNGDEYEFRKDGTLTYTTYNAKGKPSPMKGTYKFKDDSHLELSHITTGLPVRGPTFTSRVYYSGSELHLTEKDRNGDFIKGRSYQRTK